MLISIVIPAYNASDTIGRTLDSVFNSELPHKWVLEVIVIDDGSHDLDLSRSIIDQYADVVFIANEKNSGVVAARNTGISKSTGDLLILLDADDELVIDWGIRLESIHEEWPGEFNLCYAACQNQDGMITAADPLYQGSLDISDILNERKSGEYLPIFRGAYIRDSKFIDFGKGNSCLAASYIRYLLDSPFWVTNTVLRTYHDNTEFSISSSWADADKAIKKIDCYQGLFSRYSYLYLSYAPIAYKSKKLRMAVYHKLASVPGAWRWWLEGASFKLMKESIVVALLLLLKPTWVANLVVWSKSAGLIRRYG